LKALRALLTENLCRHIFGEVASDDAAHRLLALFLLRGLVAFIVDGDRGVEA
jgi:hypothetical protein